MSIELLQQFLNWKQKKKVSSMLDTNPKDNRSEDKEKLYQ